MSRHLSNPYYWLFGFVIGLITGGLVGTLLNPSAMDSFTPAGGIPDVAIPQSLWSSQADREPSQVSILQAAAGELTKVDPWSQSFWIKASDGREMEFKYTDSTQVTGAVDSPEGLANKYGSRVSVTFQKDGDANIASQILVLPRF